MKSLNEKNLQLVISSIKGKRLEYFLESTGLINASLAASGWVKWASRKADKGFSQGLGVSIEVPPRPRWDEPANPMYEPRHAVNWCLGSGYTTPTSEEIEMVINDLSPKELKKVSPELIRAWCELAKEKREAVEWLNSLRPLPVLTPVGLSPKVTKTLKEMNLDIDLPSIKMAEIAYNYAPRKHCDRKLPTFGEVMIGKAKKNGAEYCHTQLVPYVKWSEGIVHGRSRFSARNEQCEACGKKIPSGRFVPVEAVDKAHNNRLVSLWVGCDCANNIFGIKDVGVERK